MIYGALYGSTAGRRQLLITEQYTSILTFTKDHLMMKPDKKLTVGIVAKKNPFTNKREWSGTVHKAAEALKAAGYNVVWVPYRDRCLSWYWLKLKMHLRYGKQNKARRTKKYGAICAHSMDQRLIDKVDVLFFSGVLEMRPCLKGDFKTVGLIDSTFRNMDGYYWRKLPDELAKADDDWYRETIHGMDKVISSNNWATDSVIKDYGVDPSKVATITFGANMPDTVVGEKRYVKGETIELLYSGFDWKRKGLLTAVAALDDLVKRGYKARLTVVGVTDAPKEVTENPNVEVVGKINKNIPEEMARYQKIWQRTQCFILPTRAECSAIVLCEAAAYGVPSVTFDTGGLADYVVDGVNGYRLPLTATPADFASKVIETADNLPEMSRRSRKIYEEKLNWDTWRKSVSQFLSDL